MNTIILKMGNETLTAKEYQTFLNGDTIWGEDAYPEELARWNSDQKDEAVKALAKHKCSYEYNSIQNSYHVKEYALEFCECDENDGEFLWGSDYKLAEAE